MGIIFSSFLKHDFLKYKRIIITITRTAMIMIENITAIMIGVMVVGVVIICWVLSLLESSVTLIVFWRQSILESFMIQEVDALLEPSNILTQLEFR